MADDGDDWFTSVDDEPTAEPEAAPAAAGAASAASATNAEGETPAESGGAGEEPAEVAEEGEYLDPDKLLLFKHWIRPKFLQYRYLYDYRHNYYNDVIDYLDKKCRGNKAEIPRPQTWAERALRTYTSKIDKFETYRRELEEKMKNIKEEKTTRRVSFASYHSKEYMCRRYTTIL